MHASLTLAALSVCACACVGFGYVLPTSSSKGRSSSSVAMTAGFGAKIGGTYVPAYFLENSNGAKATVQTYGATVTEYVDADGVVWLGKRADAVYDESKPIAGGVPHCFPQFGPGPIQQHGFARDRKWIPEERAKKMRFDRMTFKLIETDETLAMWPKKFEYRYDATLFADKMHFLLEIINKDTTPFDFTLALHTYFDVSSLKNIKIAGAFQGATVVDRNANGAESVESASELTISSAVDKLYKGVTEAHLIDSAKGKGLKIKGLSGFTDTVVWNPYGNEAMGYDKFVCIECAAASTPVTVAPGQMWKAEMELEPFKL